VPSMDAPTWWADVQQDRDDLAGTRRRPADDWLQEDIDFAPRRRLGASQTIVLDASPSATSEASADHPLHGVFVGVETAPAPRVVELEIGDDLTDEAYLAAPPAIGQRRTVQIKGRPTEARVVSQAQRHRPRTTLDRIGARPDRIALWAVVLGAILILLAALSSSSQAAEIAHHAVLLSH
jgi:hypothetical protein